MFYPINCSILNQGFPRKNQSLHLGYQHLSAPRQNALSIDLWRLCWAHLQGLLPMLVGFGFVGVPIRLAGYHWKNQCREYNIVAVGCIQDNYPSIRSSKLGFWTLDSHYPHLSILVGLVWTLSKTSPVRTGAEQRVNHYWILLMSYCIPALALDDLWSLQLLVMMFNILFIVSPKTTSFHQPLPWPHEPWALVAQPTAPVASRKPSMTSKNQAVNGRITRWSFVYPIIKKVSCISAGNCVVSFKIMALLGYQLVPINGEPLQIHHSERWWVGSF